MITVDDEIQHLDLDDREVKQWRHRSNFILLYSKYDDYKELKKDWEDFQHMLHNDQVESDWKSIELFGKNNRERYEEMMAKFNAEDVEFKQTTEYVPLRESAAFMKSSNPIQDVLQESAQEDILDQLDDDNEVDFVGTPFFTAPEMRYMGVTYLSENPRYSKTPTDTKVAGKYTPKQWYEFYSNLLNGCSGTISPTYEDWKKVVMTLSKKKDINSKQALLDLGWNPEIPVNTDTLRFATRRVSSIMTEAYSGFSIFNVSQFVNKQTPITESVEKVYPIFIIFYYSTTLFGKVSKFITKQPVSHVGISFEPSLKKIYQFEMIKGIHNDGIDQMVNDTHLIDVYTTFLTEQQYANLQTNIQKLVQSKAGYNYLGLFTIPNNINYVSNQKMVCSQFVDSMLKLADMDITGKSSNMVSPFDLHKAVRKKKYKASIYKVFFGSPLKWNADKINGFIKSLKDGSVTTEIAALKPLTTIIEAKDFPIQFDDDGNLLIDKGLDVDFEAEYSKCHLAMKQYEKAENVKAMKYCLCKLWYLNSILEQRIHTEKNRKKIREYHKVRARIINDITKYMKWVQKRDPEFDMLKEYENSVFADDKVRIRRSTILYTIDLIKKALGI